ncbi:MAG TPA: patatin-like phospholipase family protein, partial [Gemmatimonadaceae bacterium]|nr:patatin-like phospholipase family protein [Gemmatimonadaceae bacterium]
MRQLPRMVRHGLVAAVASALATAGDAHGQAALGNPAPAGTTGRQYAVLSISGGVSLGSYQAGVNWALLELFRGTAGDTVLGLPSMALASIAGASAGNINTILWAIEGCTAQRARPPEESLFWQTWIPLGVPQLLPARRTGGGERALFDRGFARDSLYREFRRRMTSPDLEQGCLIRAGITLTRIRPDTLTVGQLSVPTQRFATVFNARVTPGDTGGVELRFEWPTEDSLLTANRRFGKLVLPPKNRRGDVSDSTIFDIVEAASAFPLAFEPRFIPLYYPDRAIRDTVSEWYVDGGVFDNNPVGLALEIFAHSFPRALSDTVADTVTVIYVDPVRLRRPLDSLRLSRHRGLASGGLMSAMQLIAGAVETARQYELQLWMRDPGIASPDTLLIRLSSRSHPILGEHLGQFGAFLARPFREYDFYVGVYDGMHFVAHEYACAPRPSRQCVADVIRRLIADPPMELGTVAPPLLSALLTREFNDLVADDDSAASRASIASGATAADSSRLTILLALHAAQESQYAAPASRCGTVSLPELVLCHRQLLEILERFRAAPGVRPTARAQLRACRRSSPATDCREAEDFDALLANPVKFASGKTDEILRRLREVEHQLHVEAREGEFTDARARVAGERMDAELLATLIESMYRSRPLRPRYGAEWSPTSAPARWAHLIPYHIGGNLGSAGFELGYRPILNLGSHAALTLPITMHWRAIRLETPENDNELKITNYAGAGAGLAVRGLPPPALSAVFPEFGASAQIFTSNTDGYGGSFLVGEVYVDFSLVIGRLRLAGRATPT